MIKEACWVGKKSFQNKNQGVSVWLPEQPGLAGYLLHGNIHFGL